MLLALFSVAIHPQPEASKPNFVFILMDNLGYGEVGAYGGGVTRGDADSSHRPARPPKNLMTPEVES